MTEWRRWFPLAEGSVVAPPDVGAVASRWAAAGAIAVVGLWLTVAAVGDGSRPAVWVGMRPGTAVQIVLFATVILQASRGWGVGAKRMSIAAVLVPLLTTVVNLLGTVPLTGAAARFVAHADVWTPNGQTSWVHLLLGLALYATPRRGAVLTGLRAAGLVIALFTAATSASAHAFGGGGYALVEGILPMSAGGAAATILTLVGVAAVGAHRWPLQALIQAPSDRVLVGHLLPFVVIVPILGPLVAAVARWFGVGDKLVAALGPTATLIALAWFLGVVLRDHRRLVVGIESRDAQLVSVLDKLPVGVMLRTADGTLVRLNPGAERFVERLGVDLAAVRSSPTSLLDHVRVIDEDGNPFDPSKLPVVAAIRDAASYDARLGYVLPDGSRAWYSVRAGPVPMIDGTAGTVVTLDDITTQHESSRRVVLAERSLRLTFDHAPIGIAVIAPDGGVVQVNAAMCDLLGYSPPDLLGAGLHEAIDPDERASSRQLLAGWIAGHDQPALVDRRFRHSSGRWVYTQISVALIRDDDGIPVRLVAQVVDLTQRRVLEEELRAAAVQDPLTGLANRRALTDRLGEAQHRQTRNGGDVGLLYLDLDGFKAINDTHGHDVGDRVLIETGRHLQAATRETDTVCRIGGDEFVILCAPIDGQRGLRELVDRLAFTPGLTVQVGGMTFRVDASVGAVIIEPGEDVDHALRRADLAMYDLKRMKKEAATDGAAVTS